MRTTIKAGGGTSNLVPAGLQLALLEKTDEANARSGSSGVQFTFFLPEHRRRVYETVWTHTSKGEDYARLETFAKRLGLVDERATGEVDVDFDEANGTPVVLDVQHDEYQGVTKERLTFAGVYPLAHKKAEEYVGRRGGAAACEAVCRGGRKEADDDLGDV